MGSVLRTLSLIFHMVPRRIANKRTISEAMGNLRWTFDNYGEALVPVVGQFLRLCNINSEVQVQLGVQDVHTWRLSPSGKYSAKSAYIALF